jgi:hypothetical protein
VNGWDILRCGQSREGFAYNSQAWGTTTKGELSEALSEADGGLPSCHAAATPGKKNR